MDRNGINSIGNANTNQPNNLTGTQTNNPLDFFQLVNDFPIAFLTFNFITNENETEELPNFYNSLNGLESIINAITTEAIINNSFEEYVPPTNNKATEDEIRQTLGSYRKIADSSETSECPICFDNYKAGEYFRKLPCAHIFHKKCVDKWFKESSFSCPICRTDFHEQKKCPENSNNTPENSNTQLENSNPSINEHSEQRTD